MSSSDGLVLLEDNIGDPGAAAGNVNMPETVFISYIIVVAVVILAVNTFVAYFNLFDK